MTSIVCGPDGVAGVTYATVGGQEIQCGTDSGGAALTLQVSTLSDGAPVDGGIEAGFEIGGAVLGVMAVAFAAKLLMRYLQTAGDES